jgi:2'-5' RNA ligase
MICSVLRRVSLTLALAMMASLAARAAEPVGAVSQDPARDVLKDPAGIVAIDVLLEPSADMAAFAEAANKGLRRAYPAGYSLGDKQVPHISLVHRFVRVGDLPALEAKLARVLKENNPLVIELTATGYSHSEWDGLALMIIDIQHNDALSRVQAKVADVVQEFAVPDGTVAAFAVNDELPKVDESIVTYVKEFIPKASGKNFKPHITIGRAQAEIVTDIEAVGFPHRRFRARGVAIYQLGDFGTAQKRLGSWNPREANP